MYNLLLSIKRTKYCWLYKFPSTFANRFLLNNKQLYRDLEIERGVQTTQSLNCNIHSTLKL